MTAITFRAVTDYAGKLTRLFMATAIVGGALWVFKGGAILLGHDQPPYAFEVAPLGFAIATLGLTRWLPTTRRRRIVTGLTVMAVTFCMVAAVATVVFGGVLGPDLGIGVLATTAALILLGMPLRRSDHLALRLPFLVGVGTIPLMLVGGALAVFDERLLELPIVLLGGLWIVLGAGLPRLAELAGDRANPQRQRTEG